MCVCVCVYVVLGGGVYCRVGWSLFVFFFWLKKSMKKKNLEFASELEIFETRRGPLVCVFFFGSLKIFLSYIFRSQF